MNIEELFTQIMMRFDKIDNTLDRMTRTKDGLDGDSLLDNYDMCMLLNIDKRTLARYRQRKLVSYYKIKGKVYYKASEIHEWMKRTGRIPKSTSQEH